VPKTDVEIVDLKKWWSIQNIVCCRTKIQLLKRRKMTADKKMLLLEADRALYGRKTKTKKVSKYIKTVDFLRRKPLSKNKNQKINRQMKLLIQLISI
jgi:hypothetical protein